MNGIFSQRLSNSARFNHLIVLALSLFVLPSLLSAQTLLHRYSFVSDASDSVGGSTWDGTLEAPNNGGTAATIDNGLSLPGGAGSGFVSLPEGILLGTTNLTIECWTTQVAQQNWAELLNFGTGGTATYLALIADFNANNNNLGVGFRLNNTESDAVSTFQLPDNQEQYIAVTFNTNTLVGSLYTNGTLVASVKAPNMNYTPGFLGGAGGTTVNTLGVDPWNDPPFQGTIYELRIWNGIISQRQMAASAILGPNVLVTNLVPTSMTVTAGPSVNITGTEQANVTVNLKQTGSADLSATGDATNWVSSDPSVLVVSSSGVISGVGVGTATVSATIDGVTATSSTITVTGPQTLEHRYSFVSDASDSVGGAQWDGTLVAPSANGTAATIDNGLTLPGGGGPGYSGYLSLPGGILTNSSSITIETWVTQNNGNTWAQIWNFGNGQSQNMGLIPLPGRDNGNLEAGISPNSDEIDVVSQMHFPTNSEEYVAFVVNSYKLTGSLYVNGVLVATNSYPNRTYLPEFLGGTGGTTNNILGQDPYNDPQFQGVVHELRIWNGAMSPVYVAVANAAGSSVVVTNVTPQSLTMSVNTSMVGAGTQQATISGDFIEASGVSVTGAATNWTSSDPSVLTVSSSGLITALNGGTATVSAMVNGVTVTSATITVASTPPVFTQKPADQTAAVYDTVTLSAAALGGNLNYQWSFDSTPIAGATNATLTLADVSLADAGTYTITVTNTLGSTNASAVVTIDQAILKHRYSFVSDATDSVGGPAWNGTLVAGNNPATINNGLSMPGTGTSGTPSGYVSLPKGILSGDTSVTVECWVTQNAAQTWAELWSFGQTGGTVNNFALIPSPASGRNNGNMIVAFTPNEGEVDVNTASPLPSGSEQYLAVTYNNSNLTASIYTNGMLDASAVLPDTSYSPGSYNETEDVLGPDPYSGDPMFNGTIYEFRIWDGVVSPLYLAISSVAGPSVVVTNLTPQSLDVSVTNSSMIVGQIQQASVIGNFVDASGINATASATNWTSSDSSVLTVNSNGVITAIGSGSATISAMIGGVTGTSSSITVPTSAPVITQEPQASETLLVGATLSTSIADIGNPPLVYRWYLNGGTTPVSTSTNVSTLTIPNLQMADAGSYSCIVSNQYGTAQSSSLDLTVIAPTTYQQAVLQLNPIAFWPLNESDGTIAYDVIGGHNGTYEGYPTFGEPGPTNSFFGSSTAVGFDGATTYVDIPGDAFNTTNAVTVMAWVELTSAPPFAGIIGHGDPSWRLSVNGSSAQPGGNDGTSASSDATSLNAMSYLKWYLVAYTYSGVPGQANNGTLYVNGVVAAHNTVMTPPVGDNLDVWIGGSPDYPTTRLLPANIADAAVFNQALTSAQVQGIYNGMAVAGPQKISISHSGSNITLNWQTGTLLQSTSLLGPWTTNSAAVSPYTVPATNAEQYFKLLVNP